MTLTVRLLEAADADAYRDIRIEGVQGERYAFERTIEEVRAQPLESLSERLAQNSTWGVFDETALGGIASLRSQEGPKVQHRGHVSAVYVRPHLRGSGASDLLMRTLIGAARARGHIQLYLVVSSEAPRAVRFYQRHGFATYGTDPRGLFSEGRYVDDYLMMLRLD